MFCFRIAEKNVRGDVWFAEPPPQRFAYPPAVLLGCELKAFERVPIVLLGLEHYASLSRCFPLLAGETCLRKQELSYLLTSGTRR